MNLGLFFVAGAYPRQMVLRKITRLFSRGVHTTQRCLLFNNIGADVRLDKSRVHGLAASSRRPELA